MITRRVSDFSISNARLNRSVSVGGSRLDIASLDLEGGGGVAIVWEQRDRDESGEFDSGVFGRALDASGSPLSSPRQINSSSPGHQFNPVVTSSSGGPYTAAWGSFRRNPDSDDGIYIGSINASGPRAIDDDRVNPLDGISSFNSFDITTAQISPNTPSAILSVKAVAYAYQSTNVIVQLHQAERELGSRISIYSGDKRVRDVRAESLSNGNFIVSWTTEPNGLPPRGIDRIWHQLLSSSGEKLGGRWFTNLDGNIKPGTLELTALANGNFLQTWRDGDNIQAQKVTILDDGSRSTVSNQIRLNDTLAATHALRVIGASTAALPDGGFVATWTDSDSSGTGVRGQRFNSSLNKVGNSFRVNSSETGNQGAPKVALLNNSEFVVAWNDTTADSIEAAIFALNENPTARNDTYQAIAGRKNQVFQSRGVLNNDSDPDGDRLESFLLNQPQNGAVFLNKQGGFDFTPNAGFTGIDTFTYEARDGKGGKDTATVTLNVQAAISRDPDPDFNGDGKPDILWRHYGDGTNVVWRMNNKALLGGGAFSNLSTDWRMAAAADFNNDGNGDIFWRNQTTGASVIWYMNDRMGITGSNSIPSPGLEWELATTGDFNNDGQEDLVWRHRTGGTNVVWYLNSNGQFAGGKSFQALSNDWSLEASGDFNGDGNEDLVWRNYVDGSNAFWYTDGNLNLIGGQNFARLADTNWRIEGSADMNQDGKADLLLRHYGNGTSVVWYMDNTNILAGSGSFAVLPDTNWQMVV